MKNLSESILIVVGLISAVASLFTAPLGLGIIAIILCITALVKNKKTNILSIGKKWLAYIAIILAVISIIYSVFLVKDIVDDTTQKLDVATTEARDARRFSDVKILNIAIQLYALDTEALPTAKDSDGSYKTLELIKDSADFNLLLAALKNFDPTLDVPVDPFDPDRSYEYFSDGENYTIKVFFESDDKEDCQPIESSYCEYEITGSLTQILY
ncbi:MAG: DUF4190 domain-containing protein [bacterium]